MRGGRSFAERLRAVTSGPGVEVTPPDDGATWEIALPEPVGAGGAADRSQAGAAERGHS